MWLGKLFGARQRELKVDPDEEPARFAAPLPPDSTGTPTDFKRRLEASLEHAAPTKKPGFDPYNSGSFKKKDDAWVRIGRR